jgi:hypothetical protein
MGFGTFAWREYRRLKANAMTIKKEKAASSFQYLFLISSGASYIIININTTTNKKII